MAKKKIEYDENCGACKGTGIYSGVGESKGIAVVCEICKGTGCIHKVREYDKFEKKKRRNDVKRVIECNPGISVHVDKKKNIDYKDFGGMDYEDWYKGRKFKPGMEIRKFTCPAWYYSFNNSARKPKWKECAFGTYHTCDHFENKNKCWKRWDKEFKNHSRFILSDI